ncbi:RNHCP domain-containing protein [Nocardia sp. NPDC006044]|uniref:RNHCP domain-containing protein n=1 Tax=Nocardia sp. NPDC006044 TaxID=3364306 RepID=UPI0036A18DC4
MPRRKPAGHRPQRAKHVLHGRAGESGDAFRCLGCRMDVPVAAPGTAHRNHCPHCLTSRHVDRRVPGDRAEPCKGRMEAGACPPATTANGSSSTNAWPAARSRRTA